MNRLCKLSSEWLQSPDLYVKDPRKIWRKIGVLTFKIMNDIFEIFEYEPKGKRVSQKQEMMR